MRRTVAAWLGLALLLATVACLEPKNQRPGLYISGTVVNEPVSDWSFTNDVREIFVETRAWYLLPHSVTTHCAVAGGKLYVGSIYRDGGEFPSSRPWNRNAMRNPHVRLKIGDKIYRRQAVHVTDPAEAQAVAEAIAAKYERPWREVLALPADQRPPVHFFRMDPRPD